MFILTANGKFLYNYSIDAYLPKPLAECKIAYIITAATKMDETGEVEKARLRDHIRRYKEKMDELKYDYTEIDIAGLSPEEVKSTLSKYDVVLVEGGILNHQKNQGNAIFLDDGVIPTTSRNFKFKCNEEIKDF